MASSSAFTTTQGGNQVKRVVVVGAESTGKTTMIARLKASLMGRGGVWSYTHSVPEYGRDYTVQKLAQVIREHQSPDQAKPTMQDLVWMSAEFDHIALEQAALEDAAAVLGGPVLLCDTDVFATAIWHERYCGFSSPSVEALSAQRRPDLYFLTHHDDVPFIQDDTRDGEHLRAWMTGRFAERLAETQRPYIWLRGDQDTRCREALLAIDGLVSSL